MKCRESSRERSLSGCISQTPVVRWHTGLTNPSSIETSRDARFRMVFNVSIECGLKIVRAVNNKICLNRVKLVRGGISPTVHKGGRGLGFSQLEVAACKQHCDISLRRHPSSSA